jgi:DNA repair exonuclease SbcCD ATPase subunit
MVIKVLKIRMLNFKGIFGSKEIALNPDVTQILGANRTGKTTISDAVQWCLFGKNSDSKTDFGIKTKVDGKVVPEISHEVELLLTVDGKEVSLRRCWDEKWTKPKAREEKQLTGHTSSFFIDGNKYSEKDYNEYIENLCPYSIFRAITNTQYFTDLKADEQRALLTKMVGEVSNEIIAESNADFEAMLEQLNGRTLEAYMQHLSYRKSQIKDELERIPVRITEQKDEITRITPENQNWGKVEGDLQACESVIKRIDDEIADRSKTVDAFYNAKAQERTEINKLREKVQTIEYNARTSNTDANRKRSHAISNAENALQDAKQELAGQRSKKESAERTISSLEVEKQDFRKRWSEANNSELEMDDNEFVCPVCNRRLEDSDILEKSDKMRENFNRTKASKIEVLELEAEHLKKRDTQTKAIIEDCNRKISEWEGKIPELEKAISDAESIEVQSAQSILEANAEYNQLKEEIESRTQALNAPSEDEPVDNGLDNLKSDRKQMEEKRDELKKHLYIRDTINGKNKRIKELEEQEKTLNQQLSELEREEYVAQEFTKSHIVELERKVNELFENVRFTMFDHKLNGTLKPICECTVGGVPYSDLNNADRINAGIDIINAICRYNNVYAPCFIDNAESINDIVHMDSQAIHLIVSRDKELTIINN